MIKIHLIDWFHIQNLLLVERKNTNALEAAGGMCVWNNMSGFNEMNKNNFRYCLLSKLCKFNSTFLLVAEIQST